MIMAAAAVVFSSCSTGSGSLRSEQDSVAYAIGLSVGRDIKNVDSTLNISVIAAGMRDVIRNKPKMDDNTASSFLREYFMVRKPAKAKRASREFLAGVAKQDGVQITADSMLFKIITPGDDTRKAVSDFDTVRVIYTGMLPSGKVFDSSKNHGGDSTITFPLNRVIPAWTEGMKLVGKGGTIKLWVPPHLAYGEQGAPPTIGPNQALIFEVTVVDVMPGKAPEVKPAVPAKPAVRR